MFVVKGKKATSSVRFWREFSFIMGYFGALRAVAQFGVIDWVAEAWSKGRLLKG